MNGYRLYTVGHSNQSQDEFLELIKKYDVNCIVDVRSVPASKYAPQFNMESLKWFLNRNEVQYLHFGDEFGARRTDCIDDTGQVNFELAVETPNFHRGAERLLRGMERGYHISLMCSESNPLECHRFSLISRFFHERGLEVLHIKPNGLKAHADLEKEMVNEFLHSRKYRLAEVDQLFGTYTLADQLRDAYRLKNKEIGYKPQLEFAESY